MVGGLRISEAKERRWGRKENGVEQRSTVEKEEEEQEEDEGGEGEEEGAGGGG